MQPQEEYRQEGSGIKKSRFPYALTQECESIGVVNN